MVTVCACQLCTSLDCAIVVRFGGQPELVFKVEFVMALAGWCVVGRVGTVGKVGYGQAGKERKELFLEDGWMVFWSKDGCLASCFSREICCRGYFVLVICPGFI